MLKNKKKNKGAAIIMVIVALSFIAMLVAMIIYMAYANYLMKGTDKAAKNTFYSAETVLDVIKAGLEKDVSDVMAEAYIDTVQDATGSTLFEEQYINGMTDLLAVDKTATPIKWKYDFIKDKLNSDSNITIASAAGSEGAYLEYPGNDDPRDLIISGFEYIKLKNIRIVYTDPKGYVSIVQTDIKLPVPDMAFSDTITKLEIENYSIIANTQLVDDGLSSYGGATNATITGNVYGGKDGMLVANQASLEFKDDTTDAKDDYYLISKKIGIDNTLRSKGVIVNDKYLNYTGDVEVNAGKTILDGKTYVKDDLTVGGSDSVVILKGAYVGYGDSTSSSSDSSSILVNGPNTTLNFSNLKELLLAGHAYVGARRYDADETRYKSVYDDDEHSDLDKIEDLDAYDTALKNSGLDTDTDDSIERNKSDILMGESIAVKTDQLIYMVPSECVGYLKSSKQPVYCKNPLSYSEYRLLVDTKAVDENGKEDDKYILVNWDKLPSEVRGLTTEKVIPVFRRVNGSVYVYLYLDFGGNDVKANSFFSTYYANNKESLKSYIDSYIKDIKWNPDLEEDDEKSLALAGNFFYYDKDGNFTLKEDNINTDADKNLAVMSNAELYGESYEALLHVLNTDYNNMTSEQASQDVFTNIVDEGAVKNTLKTSTYETTDKSVRAKVTLEDSYVYDLKAKADNIKLIVAMGDVILKADFDGLVVAKGNVYIGSGCNQITYNAADVKKAMRAQSAAGNYAYEAFGKSGKYTYAAAGLADPDEEAEHVDIADYVLYDNWKKE